MLLDIVHLLGVFLFAFKVVATIDVVSFLTFLNGLCALPLCANTSNRAIRVPSFTAIIVLWVQIEKSLVCPFVCILITSVWYRIDSIDNLSKKKVAISRCITLSVTCYLLVSTTYEDTFSINVSTNEHWALWVQIGYAFVNYTILVKRYNSWEFLTKFHLCLGVVVIAFITKSANTIDMELSDWVWAEWFLGQTVVIWLSYEPKFLMEEMSKVCLIISSDMPNISKVKVYISATMWHETEEEMIELLQSVMKIDKEILDFQQRRKLHYKLEAHIFFDDAFTGLDGSGQTVNHWVRSFFKSRTQAFLKIYEQKPTDEPFATVTPYGGRLSWTLPGGTSLVLHMKDKVKVRRKKRWSQIMYIHYLLEYLNETVKNTFILALDGDTSFEPKDITRLVQIMADKTIGAVCGRIHPIGNGPLVWYQKFEYALGHWIHKAAEEIYGNVLCSPGCFSFFRAEVLLQVVDHYATEAVTSGDYLKFDQGEDRFLTTLIIRQGHRVKYNAISNASTRVPESFQELFHQRRRWEPSTMVNMKDLLFHEPDMVKNNSKIWIIYLGFLALITLLRPGHIFMIMVNLTSSLFETTLTTSVFLNGVVVLTFIIVCFTARDDIQWKLARVIGYVYAFLIICFLIRYFVEFNTSRLSILILMIGIQILVIGVLHPDEFLSIFYGIVYAILLPCMQLLVQVYSLINLYNVSWGTRENSSYPSTLTHSECNSWTTDCIFKKCKMDHISEREVLFWEDLLRKNLKPIHFSKQQEDLVSRGLVQYRNKAALIILVINFCYIVITVICMIFKVETVNQVFLCIIGIILVLQIFGMLVHRYAMVSFLIKERYTEDKGLDSESGIKEEAKVTNVTVIWENENKKRHR